ncbi:general transcription factor 3C polypeptide 1 [Caerostris darwini]|uniref:General transcription factor 3C polypeptide 1 n=1 Tax=Caerostris darwini TaxID=1538125 RepID=A0AAV4RJ57_9ARAC|nr:general transcription factor 3C polypeptide 1 [Caerostris darwini]
MRSKKDYDFLSAILDEIALEGLDGITLEMFWQRLKDRPNFPIAIDEDSKIYFWNIVAKHKDIEIYELPKPRKFTPVYNRYDNVDSELGVVVESDVPIPDPYAPIVPVPDVRGSCSTYNTRSCITSEIRNGDVLFISLEQAMSKWEDCLVLVASPKVRLLALIGTEADPLIDISSEAYCLLERIGRSRYLGEVTQGEGGLLALKAPFCKQLHYYRKKLTLKGLITKQNHYMKNKKGTTCTGNKPQKQESCKVLKEEIGIPEFSFKKLSCRPFLKWVRIVKLPCQEFYPNATPKDWFYGSGEDKYVRVCQLLRHCDDEGDENEDDEANDEKGSAPNVHFDASKIYYGIPLVHQIYLHIKEAGPSGISSSDLGRKMTFPRLDIRCLLSILLKKGHVISVLEDRGRQKVKKYIAEIYANQNEDYSFLKEQDVIKVVDNSSSHIGKRKHEENGTPIPKKSKINDAEKVEEPSKDATAVPVQAGVAKNIVDSDFQNIVTEISVLENKSEFTGKAPRVSNFSENSKNPPRFSGSVQPTARNNKRSNMILDYLKTERFTTLTDLQKHITEKEKEEGHTHKIDKKSTARLIHDLYRSDKIKIFKAVLKLHDEATEIEFICDTSMKPSDPHIQVVIDQAKFKYFGVSKDSSKKSQPISNQENSSQKKTTAVKTTSAVKEKTPKKSTSVQPSTVPVMSFVTPKFIRAKTLHIFLYYLVYKHKGEIAKGNEQSVYHEGINWRRFIPPLPNPPSQQLQNREGWCCLADIYSRMPLSLFLKIVNFKRSIPDLKEFLDDEEKAHLPMQSLPRKMRSALLNDRKYLFSTYEVIEVLCRMGLMSMGQPYGKQKDHIFLYVHKHASIKDTTITPPAYIHVHVKENLNYERKLYTFETEDDVQAYWLDLEHIAFHTSLGKFSASFGETVYVPEAKYKHELINATKKKDFDEVVDDGTIPGDSLGAGGFDSVMFLHCRRSWQTSVGAKTSNAPQKVNAKPKIQNLLQKTEVTAPEGRVRLERLTQNTLIRQKDSRGENSTAKKENLRTILPRSRERTNLRTVQVRRTKKRAPYYDEKDRAAMKKMDKARCNWSSQEDSFLLLCKVASSFLDPNCSKNLVVPFTVIRDLLHKHVPEISTNKSSRACQRRVRYMMLNPATMSNVNVFLGEAMQDEKLVKEFSHPKPSRTSEEAWASMFTNLINKLLEKFTTSASDRCKSISLPDSLEELLARFELRVFDRTTKLDKHIYKEPKSPEDAKKFVLTTLILSAMAVVNDDTKWSYLLHKLYQSYSENSIASIVSKLRKHCVLAVKKRSHKAELKRSLQSTGPYKFSVTYSNAMLTKFPVKIFKECENLLSSLKSLKSGTYVELKGDVPPGYAAAIVSLMQMKQLSLHTQIPDQIILFDSSLSKEEKTNLVERMINTLSDKESVEFSKLLNDDSQQLETVMDIVPSESTHVKPSTSNEKPEQQQQLQDIEITEVDEMPDADMSQLNSLQTSESQHRITSASRFALYMLRKELSLPPVQRVQHSQDYIVLNSCRVICRLKPNDDDIPDLPVIPADIVESVSDSHKVKEPICLTKDQMKLTKTQISEIFDQLIHFIPSDVFLPNKNYSDLIETLYEQYSDETLHDAKCIFSEIYCYGAMGIVEKEIWNRFRDLSGELSLFEHLNILRKSSLIIRVGVSAFTYVCGCFAQNWVLSTYRLSDFPSKCKKHNVTPKEKEELSENPNIAILPYSETDFDSNGVQSMGVDTGTVDTETAGSSSGNAISDKLRNDTPKNTSPSSKKKEKTFFIPRTWRNPDGSLNKTAFSDLLSTILSHIMSMPGISSSQVCEQFSLVLPGVQVLELIEVLEKSSCVYKYYCKPLKKKSLFSPASVVSITTNPQPEDIDHLEPLPDAVCKVAELRNAVK